MEVYNFEKRKPISTVVSCKLVETGPLRASVQVEYALTRAGTTITQTISLQTGSPRLEFQTKVDWKESRKLLRVEFPTSVRSPTASYGTQFGWIGRPTTFNTRRDIAQFEVVAHGFGDLSEYGFGVALLTGGSKYGMSARNNVLRLSLLKSSKSPDENADIGAHEFRYGLLPHAESFPCKAVMGAAASLSRPPLPITLESTTEPLGVELAGLDSVAVSAFKRADGRDDALVVRLYEALGGRGEARVSLPMPPSEVKSVALCDLLEREMDDGEDTVRLTADGEIAVRFAPFTIRSVLVVLN